MKRNGLAIQVLLFALLALSLGTWMRYLRNEDKALNAATHAMLEKRVHDADSLPGDPFQNKRLAQQELVRFEIAQVAIGAITAFCFVVGGLLLVLGFMAMYAGSSGKTNKPLGPRRTVM